MGIFYLPRITTIDRESITPGVGELMIDTDLNEIFKGDGVTVGGVKLTTRGWAQISGTKEVSGTGVYDLDGTVVADGVGAEDWDGKIRLNLPGSWAIFFTATNDVTPASGFNAWTMRILRNASPVGLEAQTYTNAFQLISGNEGAENAQFNKEGSTFVILNDVEANDVINGELEDTGIYNQNWGDVQFIIFAHYLGESVA